MLQENFKKVEKLRITQTSGMESLSKNNYSIVVRRNGVG